MAAYYGREEVSKLLIQNGASVNIKNYVSNVINGTLS